MNKVCRIICQYWLNIFRWKKFVPISSDFWSTYFYVLEPKSAIILSIVLLLLRWHDVIHFFLHVSIPLTHTITYTCKSQIIHWNATIMATTWIFSLIMYYNHFEKNSNSKFLSSNWPIVSLYEISLMIIVLQERDIQKHENIHLVGRIGRGGWRRYSITSGFKGYISKI